MTRTTSVALIAALAIIAGSIFMLTVSKMANNKLEPSPQMSPSPTPASSDLIRLEEPRPGQTIISPVRLKGEARGYWYFEASFPAKIYDANGKELGVVVVQAREDWMTENFVPFDTMFFFEKPTTPTGTLVLEKDNPSGLPEHDAQLKVDVVFDLAGWKDSPYVAPGCVVTGCSGQICSDQEVVTTCEFKSEYTCYKTGRCERQEDGFCDWTPTPGLLSCVRSSGSAELGPQ